MWIERFHLYIRAAEKNKKNMESEDFLLKWNDHHAVFFSGAEQFMERDEYTDVILAAGSRFFSAHKLVLSICSPFFQEYIYYVSFKLKICYKTNFYN